MSTKPLQTTHQMQSPPEVGSGFLRSILYLDLVLLLCVFALTGFGIWTLYGVGAESDYLTALANRQVIWVGIALIGLSFALVMDYRWLGKIAPPCYVINLILLVAVLIIGTKVNGARSWFRVGPISFQPAETMKIVTVMMMAHWFAVRPEGIQTLKDLIAPALLCGVPAFLVIQQPDLGTTSLFAIVFLAMVYWAGIKRWMLGAMFGSGAIMAICLYPFLKNYQKERLLTFIDPYRDPTGSGYNVIQSMVAVGSGEATGKGWGEGTQAVYRYLPEAHTDFIFASSIEQVGFLGAIILLSVYGLLFWRILEAVKNARDRFGAFVVIGLGAILLGHVLMNMMMNTGLFPVTGLPLPFMSYGGTFLLSIYILIGLILNIGMRRFVFNQ